MRDNGFPAVKLDQLRAAFISPRPAGSALGVPVSNPRAPATFPITPPPILDRALAACPAGLAIGLPVYGFALVVKSINEWRKPAHK